jgi:hypothetical protein
LASSSKKHILGYAIFTTSELEEKTYLTPDFRIHGSFISFIPQYEIIEGKPTKLKGSKITLPERVIKEIIYQEIDDRNFQSKSPAS